MEQQVWQWLCLWQGWIIYFDAVLEECGNKNFANHAYAELIVNSQKIFTQPQNP